MDSIREEKINSCSVSGAAVENALRCQRCFEPEPLTHRVTSHDCDGPLLDLLVCLECGRDAMKVIEWSPLGSLGVEELHGRQ